MKLTREEFGEMAQAFRTWLEIRARYDQWFPRLTDGTLGPSAAATQLANDIWHSALLWRMLGEGKLPLDAPPPTEHSYPVYPAEKGDSTGGSGA